MKVVKTQPKTCKRVRKEVPRDSTVERIFNCPQSDLNVVLKGWEKIKANYKKVGINTFQYFLVEHAFYKSLFPSFANASYADLEENEDFLIHAYAIMKGLNSLMDNLTAKYEEDNEILPLISYTHQKRGITRQMMKHMKEALLFACCTFLEANAEEKESWKTILNFIFEDYLFAWLPETEEKF